MNIANKLREVAKAYEGIQKPNVRGGYWFNARKELCAVKNELKACLAQVMQEYEEAVFCDGVYNGMTCSDYGEAEK